MLTAATLLAENTLAPLTALTAHLRRTTGLDIRGPDNATLYNSDHEQVWENDLVWACGLLTRRRLDAFPGAARIVAAPVFTGETSAFYHSVIIARDDTRFASMVDVARSRVAINELASWSGHHALLSHLRERGHHAALNASILSGSHRSSIESIRSGRADIAAIDNTLWRHLALNEPVVVAGLRIIDRTRDWPSPPFIIHRDVGSTLQQTLVDGLLAVEPGDIVGIDRIEATTIDTYRQLDA